MEDGLNNGTHKIIIVKKDLYWHSKIAVVGTVAHIQGFFDRNYYWIRQ